MRLRMPRRSGSDPARRGSDPAWRDETPCVRTRRARVSRLRGVSDDDRSGHLLFVPSPKGYRLEERAGPGAGGRRAGGGRGRSFVVSRVGPSPYPLDPRRCAYLALVLNRLVDGVTHLIGDHGVPAVFFLMILESACLPVPSEVIMLFAGYLVSIHSMSLAGAVAAGVAGNLVGSWIAWGVGVSGGRVPARAPWPLRPHHARAPGPGRPMVRAARRADRPDRALPADHPHVHLAAGRHRPHAVLAVHGLPPCSAACRGCSRSR